MLWKMPKCIYNNDLFRVLSFVEHNQKLMYICEVSMLVYGDSKYFENNTLESLCALLQKYNCLLYTSIVRAFKVSTFVNDKVLSTLDRFQYSGAVRATKGSGDVYKRQQFIVKKDMPKEKIKRNHVIQIFRKRISEY